MERRERKGVDAAREDEQTTKDGEVRLGEASRRRLEHASNPATTPPTHRAAFCPLTLSAHPAFNLASPSKRSHFHSAGVSASSPGDC